MRKTQASERLLVTVRAELAAHATGGVVLTQKGMLTADARKELASFGY